MDVLHSRRDPKSPFQVLWGAARMLLRLWEAESYSVGQILALHLSQSVVSSRGDWANFWSLARVRRIIRLCSRGYHQFLEVSTHCRHIHTLDALYTVATTPFSTVNTISVDKNPYSVTKWSLNLPGDGSQGRCPYVTERAMVGGEAAVSGSWVGSPPRTGR